MAKKKLVFANDAEEEEDRKQIVDGEGTALVSPKKMKLGGDREPVEIEYACSSPSASDFIVMPAAKPSANKKPSSSKIFSDEDEIALLKGLALFWKNGRNNKWTEFYQFIKDDLANQFSKIQVSEKVRKLKIKFERARANGGRPDFSDSHEVFRLCKALWGDGEKEENKGEEAQVKRKGDDDGILKKKRKEGKKKILEKEKEGDEPEKQKEVDEDNEENNGGEVQGKRKGDDDDGVLAKKRKEGKKKILEKEKEGDEPEVDEDNCAEKMEISREDFQSDFPLLYASFDTFKCGQIIKEKCNLIPREKAQEVEEKCRELKGEALRLELRRIDLIKRDLQHHLQNI